MGKLAYAAVLALAFVVRECFVLFSRMPNQTNGDADAYLAYAYNLWKHGVFSSTGTTPDAFRSPGYPWIFYLLQDFRWMYQAQVILGVATVGCMMALGRQWMPRRYVIAAGVWMALQPHHIAATGALLTEVVFGFCLIAGLLCLSTKRPVGAGVMLGYGYLVNPVAALLPFVLARRNNLAMLAVMLLCIGGWSARNALVGAEGSTRAVVNLVQGSHPEYHDAWRWKTTFMKRQNAAINAEVEAAKAGDYTATVDRLKSDPVKYAGWYLSKPFLLFDWDVRIGVGGPYTLRQLDTPLDSGWLLVTTALQTGLNPLAFCLAFCGIVLGLFRGGTERMVALSVLYLTVVHVVLQAEPRYAIPYRSLEILLAVSAVAYLVGALKLPQVQASDLRNTTEPCSGPSSDASAVT